MKTDKYIVAMIIAMAIGLSALTVIILTGGYTS